MRNVRVHIAVCVLTASIAAAARGQAPAPAPAAQPTVPLTLSQKFTANYNNLRAAAVKAVNDKYAQLSLSAAGLFVKESNQPRADEATDWARRLGWTDDGNFAGLAPETKDRLGALQAAYLKDRAVAVISVAKANMPGVETAQQQMAQLANTKEASALGELLSEIKKDLAPKMTPSAPPGPPAPLTPGQKIAADFNAARTAAVKEVNDKYAKLSLEMVDQFVKENNQARADEATDWARRLGWTDDVGNFKGLTTDTQDRLGALQTAYLKERAAAVAVVDKARLADLETAQGQISRETDPKGAVALLQTVGLIRHDLGITAPAVSRPVASRTSAEPQGTPGTGPASSQPFGVQADQLKPVAAPSQ